MSDLVKLDDVIRIIRERIAAPSLWIASQPGHRLINEIMDLPREAALPHPQEQEVTIFGERFTSPQAALDAAEVRIEDWLDRNANHITGMPHGNALSALAMAVPNMRLFILARREQHKLLASPPAQEQEPSKPLAFLAQRFGSGEWLSVYDQTEFDNWLVALRPRGDKEEEIDANRLGQKRALPHPLQALDDQLIGHLHAMTRDELLEWIANLYRSSALPHPPQEQTCQHHYSDLGFCIDCGRKL